jgi:hypothetical protein
MLAPKSYTREDVVELQCHGSDVCLQRVLRACLEAGARLAEPGLCVYFFVSFLSIRFLMNIVRYWIWCDYMSNIVPVLLYCCLV